MSLADVLSTRARSAAAALLCAVCAAALPATAPAAGSSDGWMSAISAGSHTEKPRPHVFVELVAEKTALTPQAENRLAVRFTHEEGWHTYWRMPGDAGLPPEFSFTLPGEIRATAPLFPLPERTITSGLTSFGYGGVTLFPFRVEVPRGASGNVTVALHVEYLACREMCVPESADATLRLPIAVSGKETPEAAEIARALKLVPERAPDAQAACAKIEENRIRIDLAGGAVVAKSLDFLPFEKNVLKLSAAPASAVREAEETGAAPAWSLWLTAADRFALAPAKTLEGVLVADGGPQRGGWAVETSIPLEAGPVAPPPAAAAAHPDGHAAAAPVLGFTALSALAFAFLGGLILNLMPCVFPVLSLKLLDLMRGAGEGRRLAGHGFAFTAGVVLTMLVLSGTLIGLRSAGHALGWGFQLQSPMVVSVLALLFTGIACNLLGFFEFTFGSRVADARALRAAPQAGLPASFLTGVLAVVVASPCTAPFMGAALGYALTQPVLEALLVFVALGLGMSLPWLLLCLFPAWAKRLPKPGPWMETFRRVMAVPMLLAVLWLVWVLSRQLDFRGVLTILCGMGALGAFCWLFGRRQWGRATNTALMALLVAVSAAAAVVAGSGVFSRTEETSSAAAGWAPWSPEAVETALAEGHPVFVDFTAAWCLTCQANRVAALDRGEVLQRMDELGYVRLEGDWTNRNPEIARVLAEFGRSGVPLYLIHRPGGRVEVLPELLTPGIVIEALERK